MSNSETVRVWDPGVRLFHWLLVAMFIVAYFTADEENIVHIYSGYAVLGLISFRVVWGFIGTSHARFSDFIYAPQKVMQYTRGLMAGKPERYLGHNPLAGWMVVVLLAGLFVISVSGLKLYAVEEGRGPLAGTEREFSLVRNAHADREGDEDEDHEYKKGRHEKDNEGEEEFWEEVHELSTNITLFLIALHILGVVFSSRIHNENLIKAMITGNKEKEIN